MKYEIILNNQVSKEAWLKLFNKNEFASPFQSPDAFEHFQTLDSIMVTVHAVQNIENDELSALVVVVLQREKV